MRGGHHVRRGRASDGVLSLTPHYYQIQGRAAEIARAVGSPAGGAEHLLLGMLHDGGWPVSVISPLVDLGQAEAAVLAVMNGPGYSPPPAPRLPGPNGYVQLWGADVAIEMGDSYIGAEHAGQPGPSRARQLTAKDPRSRPAFRSPAVTINVADNMWNIGTTALDTAFRRRWRIWRRYLAGFAWPPSSGAGSWGSGYWAGWSRR